MKTNYVVEARVPLHGPTPKETLGSIPEVYSEVVGGTFPIAKWDLRTDEGIATPVVDTFYLADGDRAIPIDPALGNREALSGGFLTVLQRAWRRAALPENK